VALKHSYTFLAPIYDSLVSGPLDVVRIRSLDRLQDIEGKRVLINGICSGLDLPYLPDNAEYIATDITPAMLNRAIKRAAPLSLNIEFQIADSQALPFADDYFDIIVMHLILAVVPNPEKALAEACRVLKLGGKIYIFDKFIRRGQLALVRRFINIFLRHIATRTDVIFEDALQGCDKLRLIKDEPALAAGWFRLIELEKS